MRVASGTVSSPSLLFRPHDVSGVHWWACVPRLCSFLFWSRVSQSEQTTLQLPWPCCVQGNNSSLEQQHRFSLEPYIPFKQISVYGSLGQIHRMVFEWLGDLRTFIGCQNPLEALFCRIREAICLLWAVTAHFWISTVDFWSYCFLVEFGQDLPTFHLDSWLGQASACHPRCSSGSSCFFPFQGQFSVSFTHQNPRQDPLICVFSVTPNPASSLCGECDLQLLQNDFFGLCWLQGALPTFISCLLPVLLG